MNVVYSLTIDGGFELPDLDDRWNGVMPRKTPTEVRDTWGTSQAAQEGMRAMMALVGQPETPEA